MMLSFLSSVFAVLSLDFTRPYKRVFCGNNSDDLIDDSRCHDGSLQNSGKTRINSV